MSTSVRVNINGQIERDTHREMVEYWLRNAEDHQIHSFDQYLIELAIYGFNTLPGRYPRGFDTTAKEMET